jgi:hypothetical protein
MTQKQVSRNRALVRFIVLPMIFLTVTLLGGLRVSVGDRIFIFVAPPLITLLLAVLLMVLLIRGRLIEVDKWIRSDQSPLTNISNSLTLISLFFASSQAFNSVLPERGLLFWLISFFFVWTLWNNLYSFFDAKRLLRSLAALFGTAFLLKHMLMATLYAPEGSWLKRLAGVLLEGISLGTLAPQVFAPATGYISFFTLSLYVVGLILLWSAPGSDPHIEAQRIVAAYRDLPHDERRLVLEGINRDQKLLTSAEE